MQARRKTLNFLSLDFAGILRALDGGLGSSWDSAQGWLIEHPVAGVS